MDGTAHFSVVRGMEGLCIFFKQDCGKLVAALPYDYGISRGINQAGTEIGRDTVFLVIDQDNADNSGKAASRYRDISDRKHQRTVFKKALRPKVAFRKGAAAVALQVARCTMEPELLPVTEELSVDLVPHTINAVSAL